MQENPRPQDLSQTPAVPPQPAQVISPAGGHQPLAQPAFVPQSPPVIPSPPKKSKKGLILGLLLLVLLAGGAAAYWFLLRPGPATTTNTNQTDTSTQPEMQPEKKVWAPFRSGEGSTDGLTVSHDDTWADTSAYNKYWSITRGLIKDAGAQKYALTLKYNRIDGYDYMDRAAGGAYPPGTLYKSVETEGMGTVYIGTFSSSVGGTQVFASSCPLTANGGCSFKGSEGGENTWLMELHRYDESKDNDVMDISAAISPLDLTNATDQQVLDEFVGMLSSLSL